jgi:hypothetical protein
MPERSLHHTRCCIRPAACRTSRYTRLTCFDLYNLTTVAEVRAGINTRNVAVSADGSTLLVGNTLPRTLVLLQADDLSLLKVIDVVDGQGASSRHGNPLSLR